MPDTIRDGVGKGTLAEVDSVNRLMTRGIDSSIALEAANNGDFEFVSSGFVTLTAATESAILWYKNDGEEDLIMDAIMFVAKASTGGTTDYCILSATRNPTAMSGGSGSDPIQINSNLGSSKSLTISGEIGQEAATLTGGSPGPSFTFEVKRSSELIRNVIIPSGSSIGFRCTPPAGNTSIEVAISCNLYKKVEI